MKEYTSDQLRNVALVGHQGAGKTSLVESLLFNTGAITRMGKIEESNTVADYDEDERSRTLSIFTALVPVEVDGCKVNVLDAPGFVDFMGEAKNAVRVSDAAVVVVDAVAGPEVGTELAFDYAREFELPVLVVVNKMDRENANFTNTLDLMRKRFPNYRFVPVTLPIGSQADFSGVVDVLAKKAYKGAGKDASDVPADLSDELEEARMALTEAAAESNDTLLEKYLETLELSDEETREGAVKVVQDAEKRVVPVFATSSTHSVGLLPLLRGIITFVAPPTERRVVVQADEESEPEYLKTPLSDSGPVVAYVYHTQTDKYGTLTFFRLFSGSLKPNDNLRNLNSSTDERMGSLMTMRGETQFPLEVLHAGDLGVVAKLRSTGTGNTLARNFDKAVVPPQFARPIFAVALHPRTQSDGAKMGTVLSDICRNDPTLHWRMDPSIKQTILEGMGSTHIDVAIKRAERMGVGIDTTIPKVPYQETITRAAEGMHRHKKQTGGAGQFGEVSLRIQPLDTGEFEFHNEVVGGAISQSFVSSAEKGVRSVLDNGVIAGYPVKFVRVAVYDGKMHPVDSKDIAFQIAGRTAFREAFEKAGPVLLEPIMTVRVVVPEDNMGDIMSDMNTRRGRVMGMETELGRSIVTAEVPLAEIQRYSNDLRSMTAGRGVYTMEFSRYERVPANIQAEIVAKSEKGKEEDEE